MNVLSLFDGMSCGQIALERIGINVDKYYASEIKPIAIKFTKEKFENTIHVGDVTKVGYSDGILYTENGNIKTKIDLIIGGSPCQDFSVLKTNNAKGLEGDKSHLFYTYLRILREVKPKYFLLENVKMKQASKQALDDWIGVEGIYINSRLVSFQNRPRFYWTNIPNVIAPEDKFINFQDFKDADHNYCKQFKVKQTPSRLNMWNGGNGRNSFKGGCDNKTYADKINCITRKQDRSPNSGLIEFEDFCRYLTRREIELGQTLTAGWCDSLSYSQMQDLCGDGWTVDVIAHILSFITKEALNDPTHTK